MTCLVTVRVSPPSVTIGDIVRGEQWAEMYALLALQRRDAPLAFVPVERVHRLEGWKHKHLSSVGKEVARHLAGLQKKGFGGVLTALHRTKAWRLTADVELLPSAEAVFEWLELRVVVESNHLAWGQELRCLAEATVLLRNGRVADAQDLLREHAMSTRDRGLLAWRALLEGRAAYMGEDEERYEKLDGLIDAWERSTDPAGRAVEARLRSFRAMQERFEDAERTRATLTKMATDLEIQGDAGTLGIVLNVLGVLERRSGEPTRAFEHVSRAAGLLAVAGDYHTLQAALFNAALAHRGVLRKEGLPPDDLALSLLDLCILVCREFHVGGDSALAETTQADWLLDRGELSRAAARLEEASSILSVSESSYDQACFLEVRARMGFLRRAPMSEVERDVNAAMRIFGEVGDRRAEERLRERLRDYRRERRT